MRILCRACALSLALLPVLPATPVQAQAGSKRSKRAGKKLTDREYQILDRFRATRKRFLDDGRISLYYNFEGMASELVEDWSPRLKKTKSRIRWSRGLEGTYTTVEHGIIVSDVGTWIQKARFLPDLEVTVELLSVAPYRKGTILAPVFFNPKKKTSLGSNDGNQIVCMRGTRLARSPHPKEWKTIAPAVRRKVGFKFVDGVFESFYNKRKTASTASARKLTKGFDVPGHPGLAWTGSVQCFIFGVTIEGKLDPEWVAKELGEETGKGKTRRR